MESVSENNYVIQDGRSRIALLRNKPVLVEVQPTRLLKCFSIARAVACEMDSLVPHDILLTPLDRLVSSTDVLFLDNPSIITELYKVVQQYSGFQMSKKHHQWYLLQSGALLLLNDQQQQQQQPQTAYYCVPRNHKFILKQETIQPLIREKLIKLPVPSNASLQTLLLSSSF